MVILASPIHKENFLEIQNSIMAEDKEKLAEFYKTMRRPKADY